LRLRIAVWCLFSIAPPLAAQVVVLSQPGFPTIDSKPVEQATLLAALGDAKVSFKDLEQLSHPESLAEARLLVLPYGSAVPVEDWAAIEVYLHAGGNLLVLGGQPLRVPVTFMDGRFIAERPQDTYARTLDLRHSYEVPVAGDARFSWSAGYAEKGATPQVRAEHFYAEEGRLDGLGYMQDASSLRVAAPVIVLDRNPAQEETANRAQTAHGSRIVALDFDPAPGYWQSADGVALIRRTAAYAQQGAERFFAGVLYSTIRPGEVAQVTLHLDRTGRPFAAGESEGEARVEVRSREGSVEESATLPLSRNGGEVAVPLRKVLAPGFYTVSAHYSSSGKPQEFYETGFWVASPEAVQQGPALGVGGDFLTLDRKPFLPVGSNYFTTEEDGWDFSSARNAWVWEKDFAEMEAHGVTFVRTGVWMSNAKFIESSTGGVKERFLRNLEAFLLCAERHHIAVNFTFFAFTPHSGAGAAERVAGTTPANPYTDASSVRAQQAYVRSVVERFKTVPWLSWDLINEPSFSNPRQIFRGNIPNGDATEVAAWHDWLRKQYVTVDALARAWVVTPEELGSFEAVPLPAVADLTYQRYGNPRQVRALDYNLFAQDVFSGWVRTMVATIHATGSEQLIDVGQDEGGVTDRLLNQFYSSAGVSFTTNHTYWQDDALLWDSVAAKRVGMPNITGETGYQPAWAPDGTWRYDEFTGLGLTERKWALGFAAGSSGALQWDWAREADFGIERSDGSAKVWETMMAGMGAFAKQAAPYATGLLKPEVALVLPQSYQLSVDNKLALTAQQTAVRTLYNQSRGEAYAVGEYQIESLGSPKLILLPSAFGLTEEAWQTILERVKLGAVLLVTGPFDGDAHLHPTGRQDAVGIPYRDVPLTLRENRMHWAGGDDQFAFTGIAATVVSRAELPGGEDWVERPWGKGKILFAALPLELSDNLAALGRVYRYAMQSAGVVPPYTTELANTGMLICPTRFPHATLYVITSESNQAAVSFTDARSGKSFSGTLPPGRAALLLVGESGKLLATYNWTGN
jgi:Beta-galactosidase